MRVIIGYAILTFLLLFVGYLLVGHKFFEGEKARLVGDFVPGSFKNTEHFKESNKKKAQTDNDVLMPRGSGSSTFFPHLDNFKEIDTVVYDLSGTSLPQYIPSPRFAPKDIAPAFDTVFLDYESLKVAPVYANFQQMSSSERYKNNILNISITVTNVKKKLLETNEVITLVSVSHRLRRGNEKTIIPTGNYAVAFIYNGNKEQYLNDVRSSIRTLIGHIPNYIICANEPVSRKQCKGPTFRYHEMENVE
ncbi:MAG: hypothetical protein COA45_10080 [Zetaproteobacteria bacterium]|nr:MAG: hypothetical protein COA45_10080 [Zetaproteobacteria bacterium]